MSLKINNKQKEAFKKMKQLKIGALFMQMGTGKTKVAIELVDYNNCDLSIYVTPFSTKENIEKEFKKWNLKTPYYLVGYESISGSDLEYLKILKMIKNKKVFIIADESIFIKNDETKRFNRLINIRKECEYALLLNGTPLTKNEYDLYNQMYFLSPKIINMDKNEFRDVFFTKIEYKRKYEKPREFYKFSKINADYLYKLIEPYIFKCDLHFDKYEEEKIEYIMYNGNEYYKKKNEELDKCLKYGSLTTILSLLTSLNYIASNYEEKNKKVIEYVKNKQIIVYCNYLKEVEFYKKNMDCYIITGNTNKMERSKIIEEFKNNLKPLVMTFGVGAFSLNLQFCNEIVYSSVNFDFGKIEQSKYRIKRLGQENNIKYTYILTDLGITDLVMNCIKKKKKLNELIKENIKNGEYKWLKNI